MLETREFAENVIDHPSYYREVADYLHFRYDDDRVEEDEHLFAVYGLIHQRGTVRFETALLPVFGAPMKKHIEVMIRVGERLSYGGGGVEIELSVLAKYPATPDVAEIGHYLTHEEMIESDEISLSDAEVYTAREQRAGLSKIHV